MLSLHFRGFGVVARVHDHLAFPDHPEDVVHGEVQLVGLGQQAVDALLDDASGSGEALRRAAAVQTPPST
jgi:hypothetical protein